jgi:hypothetical protein
MTATGLSLDDERALVLEMTDLPPHFALFQDALELGSWWQDVEWAAMLMSRGVWYDKPYNTEDWTRKIEVKVPFTLKYTERLIGKIYVGTPREREAVYIKFGIGGNIGLEIRGKLNDFLNAQFVPRDDDRLKALKILTDVYREAKEFHRGLRDVKHLDAAGQQTINMNPQVVPA